MTLCLPLLVACPGRLAPELLQDGGSAGADGGTFVPSCAEAPRLLETQCLLCHGNPPTPTFGNLDLESPGAAARLVGQPAYTGTGGLCAGMGNLLDPGTLPATGILMDKIKFTQDCGTGMPYGALTPLPAADQDCLQRWANDLVMTMMAGNQ